MQSAFPRWCVRTRLTTRLALRILSVAFFWALMPSAQSAPAPLVTASASVPRGPLLRERITTESRLTSHNGRQYRIVVSVPKGPAPSGGFPVIYVLDADAWFGMAVEIARMREYEKLAPAVIVGIGSPRHFFFDVTRSFDFTPVGSSDPDFDGIELGGADEFIVFLAQSLKPWVASRYRVDRSRQTLFGHSLGGLFVLHVLLKAPDTFSVYLAASPSIRFSDRAIVKEAATITATPARRQVRVLVTVGGLESHPSPQLVADYRRFYTEHPEAIKGQTVAEAIDALFADDPTFDKAAETRGLVESLAHSGIKATFAQFDGEEHLSAAISALNRGIPFALRPEP